MGRSESSGDVTDLKSESRILVLHHVLVVKSEGHVNLYYKVNYHFLS